MRAFVLRMSLVWTVAACSSLLMGCTALGTGGGGSDGSEHNAQSPVFEVKKISAIVYGKGLASDSKESSLDRSLRSRQGPPGDSSGAPKTWKVELLADAYLPVAGTPGLRPAILFIDGDGDHADARTKKNSAAFGQFFASHGTPFFTIDHRLYVHAAPEGDFEAPRVDLKTAIRWLRANHLNYGVDPKRIAVMGDSAGAGICLDAGLSGRDRYQSDLPENHPGESSRPDAIVDLWGRVGVPAFDSSDPPILAIHGEKDPLVPVEWAQLIGEQCQFHKIPCTVHILKNMGHSPGEDAKVDGKTIGEAILDFVDRRL